MADTEMTARRSAAADAGDAGDARPSLSDQQARESVDRALGSLNLGGVRSVADLEGLGDQALADFVAAFSEEHIAALTSAAREAGWGPPTCSLSFRDLACVRDGRVLLDGVSGLVRAGEMVAVLGPGATALFDVLSGSAAGGEVSGEVLVNRRPPRGDRHSFMGYVVREDFHLPLLTVRETLQLSSRLRSMPHVPEAVRRLRIELAIKLLGLSKVADQLVGGAALRGISGGERRRLSIACELVADRALVLADMPTNGLDSATALQVVRQSLAACRGGNTMMLSVEQGSPELLASFDRVLCLCGRRSVFFGRLPEAVAHFRSLGFAQPPGKSDADFVTELLEAPERFHPDAPSRAQAVRLVSDGYQRSAAFQQLGQTMWAERPPPISGRGLVSAAPADEAAPAPAPAPAKTAPPAPLSAAARMLAPAAEAASAAWRRFSAVASREWTMALRDKPLRSGGVGRPVFMGLLVGSLFLSLTDSQSDARARMGLLFFASVSMFTAAFEGVPIHVASRSTYYLQRDRGYLGPATYALSTLATGAPFVALEALLFGTLAYGMAALRGQVLSGEYWLFLLVLLVQGLVARTYVFVTSMACPDVKTAQAVTPLFFVLFMLLSGYFTPVSLIPAGWRWLTWASYFRHAFFALAFSEFSGREMACRAGEICTGRSGEDWLDFYGVENPEGWSRPEWAYLGLLVVVYAAYVLLAVLVTALVDFSNRGAEVRRVDVERDAAALRGQASASAALSLGAGAGPHLALKVGPQEPAAAPAGFIEFRGLNYDVEVPNPTPEDGRGRTVPRRLLDGVSGFARPGCMVALMGSSGAGKTTLLDVLAGIKTGGTVSGQLLFNGRPRDRFYNRSAGYVEQFDSHVPTATVREAVEFSARLRLPPETPEREVHRRVQRVMEDLELAHVADRMIGEPGAGGVPPELRKKVTIAVEMVADPTILFLDEPTTGLTSSAAVGVMEATRRLARTRTVVCTIHQPSNEIVRMFDWLLLLQPGGRVAYNGPVAALADYLERQGLGRPPADANIADFALEAVRASLPAQARAAAPSAADLVAGPARVAPGPDADGPGPARDAASLFAASEEQRAVLAALDAGVAPKDLRRPEYASEYAAAWATQFALLARRFAVDSVRDPTSVVARVGIGLVMGAFIQGTIFLELARDPVSTNARISLNFFAIVFSFFATQAVVGDYVNFRPIYFRERVNRIYSAGSFYLARIAADLPVALASIGVFVLTLYWLSDIGPTDAFGLFLLAVLLGGLTALACTELITALSPSAQVAAQLIGVAYTIFLVFTGFMTVKDNIPEGWLFMYYVNPLRYALFAMLVQTLDVDDATSQQVMRAFSVEPDDLGVYFGVLVAFLVFFRAAAYLALRYVNHIKR